MQDNRRSEAFSVCGAEALERSEGEGKTKRRTPNFEPRSEDVYEVTHSGR